MGTQGTQCAIHLSDFLVPELTEMPSGVHTTMGIDAEEKGMTWGSQSRPE